MSVVAIIFVSLTLLGIASVIAMVYAVKHAEEGFEDDTGYHREKSDLAPAATNQSIVDTGNPWDQIEGSSCPWHFHCTLKHSDLTVHPP